MNDIAGLAAKFRGRIIFIYMKTSHDIPADVLSEPACRTVTDTVGISGRGLSVL